MKNYILALLLLAGNTFGLIEKRITGPGSFDCIAGDVMHQVMLSRRALLQINVPNWIRTYNLVHCGGTLINPQWVLTVKHCDESDLIVLVGTIQLPHVRDIYAKLWFGGHDIMLLRLYRSTHHNFAQLPKPQNCITPQYGSPVNIYGWQNAYREIQGVMHSYNAATLRCGYMNVISCEYPYERGYTFCARRDQVNGNKGDSGSGLTVHNVLYGIHVAGPHLYLAGPSHFIDLCHREYRGWINQETGL